MNQGTTQESKNEFDLTISEIKKEIDRLDIDCFVAESIKEKLDYLDALYKRIICRNNVRGLSSPERR